MVNGIVFGIVVVCVEVYVVFVIDGGLLVIVVVYD